MWRPNETPEDRARYRYPGMSDLSLKTRKSGAAGVAETSAAVLTGAAASKGTGLFLSQWTRLFCFGLVFAISLLVYFKTLAPTVTLVDSGELIVAARFLGVAHPPGTPLYVMLAHLATLLPFGNVAQRVNFASALFAAVASGLCSLVVIEAMMTGPLEKAPAARSSRKKQRRRPSPDPQPSRFYAALKLGTAVLAGLALAWTRTLWGYGTIAEVYTLNTLLIVSVFWLMMIWRRGIYEDRAKAPAVRIRPGQTGEVNAEKEPSSVLKKFGKDGPLLLAALIFGLALGVHHVTVGLTLPALGALVLATEGWRFFASTRLLRAAIVSVSGLSVYAYLPLAARRSPVLNWGDPVTLQRIWDHVSGKQYRVFLKFSGDQIGQMVEELVRIAGREFGPPWLPIIIILAGLGLVAIWLKGDRPLFWLLTVVIAADLGYGLSYEIAEDKDAYYLPAFIAMSIAAAFGASWAVDLTRRGVASNKLAAVLCVVIVAVPPVTELAGNYSFSNRGHYYIARDYVGNILSTVQPRGMLLTADWQVYSPLMYVREVEQTRHDVIAIDAQLLRRSWYYVYLRSEYPDLMAGARDEVEAFLEDLRGWDQNADLYDHDKTLNERINSRFINMLLAFVKYQMKSGPVYLTEDVALNWGGDLTDFTKSLTSDYQFVPEGLVFEVTADKSFHDPDSAPMTTGGLFDGTISFDPDEVEKQKVIPTYLNMLTNKGRYLEAYGQRERAIAAYKEALSLDAHFEPAHRAMATAQIKK
jgi:tetratricopeptide (TPR) repeat protein